MKIPCTVSETTYTNISGSIHRHTDTYTGYIVAIIRSKGYDSINGVTDIDAAIVVDDIKFKLHKVNIRNITCDSKLEFT